MPGLAAFACKRRTIVAVAALLLCPCIYGQSYGQAKERLRGNDEDLSGGRAELSELAKDNLKRVAASSVQIREVLLREAGLLVELKRWIANEAADNGQIVEDANLLDQAIFERLDHDIAFRSVATRLLQRYGYLLPTANPDSVLGKEEELVLKERARQLVQIEAHPETVEPQQPKAEPTSACDPDESMCDKASPRQRRSDRPPENEQPVPDRNRNLISPDGPRSVRTSLPLDGISPLLAPQIGLMSSSLRYPVDTPAPANAGTAGSETVAVNDDSAQSVPSHRKTFRRLQNETEDGDEEHFTPVRMVRQANPYADIPSLYDMYVQASAWQRPAERFGLGVFRNSANDPGDFPMDLPVGPDYVVGTGDSLAIDIWGSTSQRLIRLVDREGRISLPDTAPLLVNGKNLGEIQLDVQHALRSVFRDVSADVSVSRLRTVRVYVVGEVGEPGAYDISSLSTPLNALFAAGGITARGSLRALQHYRGKQLIEQVDAYELLLHGVRSDLKRLENGDTLQVPPVGRQVTVEGMVRRPAVYELANETSLAEALELAGGILPTAALRHIEVQRIEAHARRTMLTLDLTSADSKDVDRQLQSFLVRDGDQVHIFPIANFNEDAIYLQGHVLRPGRYSYMAGMKLTDLISSYGDLLPEPAPHYAEIVRLNAPDFHPSIESFDIAAVLSNPAAAPALKPLDTVRIFSRYDFEAPPRVWVGGEVRSPGLYRTSGLSHLRDAIYLAGGITPDAALDSAQLFRRLPDGTLKIVSVNLRQALAGDPVDNILLQPRDRLLIHRSLAGVDAPVVDIRGEVAKPGRYPLTSDMRIQDLIGIAGGLKRSAFAENADLTRFVAGGGSSDHVEIKLASALSGEVNHNLLLHNGDVLTIRQIPQWNDLGASVKVKGEVQHPATYGIAPGERLSSLLARAGGFTPEASPYGAVLIRQEVREIEMRSHLELLSRMRNEENYLRNMPEGDVDQKHAKLTAIAMTQTSLQQLEATAPVGRVVIHIPSDPARLAKTPADIALRDGDVLVIPKKTNYVLVSGQVFNPTAVSYLPGRSAKWYLSQSGGLTQIADKNAVFVVRADGSVLSARNNSGFWSGSPMDAVLKPGDSIVVPERAPKVATRNFASILQAAQVATSIALTVAYIHP